MTNCLSIIPDLLACATCMPDPGSLSSKAQGSAILFMLILLACVLGTLIYTMFSFARKQKRFLVAGVNDPGITRTGVIDPGSN